MRQAGLGESLARSGGTAGAWRLQESLKTAAIRPLGYSFSVSSAIRPEQVSRIDLVIDVGQFR